MNKKVEDYFNNYWDFKKYEDVYKDDVNAKQILKAIGRHYNIKSLIDVGCATGHTLADFKKAGVKHVIGIEKYRLPVERIHEKAKPYWIQAEAKNLDKLFQEDSFDFAFCNFLMYCNYKQAREALLKVHFVVKKGFWLHYPFADEPTDEWVDKLSQKKLLNKASMKQLIESCGFRKVTWDIWKKV